MPDLKTGSANYAVIHLLFKVKEQNFHIYLCFFILAVEKGQKPLSFCWWCCCCCGVLFFFL